MHALPIATVFTILAILFVLVRLWTRIGLVKSPGYDDLFITLALSSSITFYALLIVQRANGLGTSNQDLPADVRQNQMRYLWLSIPFYNLSLILSKLSVLVFYARVFRYRNFLIANYILMTFLIISGLWMVISSFAFCVPVSRFWTGNLAHDKHCLPVGPVWYANAIMHIFTEVMILVLPMSILSKLKLPKRKRAGVMLIFGVGIIVISISSARLYELTNMVNRHDYTKTNKEAAVWSSLETNISIICACLPLLYPFISRILSFFFRPRPLHSSPASERASNTTQLTSSHHPYKTSFFDSGIGPDGGIFYNNLFYSGHSGYSASIAKADQGEMNTKCDLESDPDAIRVVRELRIGSDSVAPSPTLVPDRSSVRNLETGRSSGSGSGRTWNDSVERDLGDFEFPDYQAQ